MLVRTEVIKEIIVIVGRDVVFFVNESNNEMLISLGVINIHVVCCLVQNRLMAAQQTLLLQ